MKAWNNIYTINGFINMPTTVEIEELYEEWLTLHRHYYLRTIPMARERDYKLYMFYYHLANHFDEHGALFKFFAKIRTHYWLKYKFPK